MLFFVIPASIKAKDRFTRDLEKGNPNGFVGHVQKMKATGGNPAHRVQKILNGETVKSKEYSLDYMKGGFFVRGTKSQLDAFGEDASKHDAAQPKKCSWFNKAKDNLSRKPPKDQDVTEAVYFTTYEEGDDDIPAGCLTNQSLPRGPLAASRKDDVFTYYFYHPEFKSGFDALNLASFMKEDSDSDSDSDSD